MEIVEDTFMVFIKTVGLLVFLLIWIILLAKCSYWEEQHASKKASEDIGDIVKRSKEGEE